MATKVKMPAGRVRPGGRWGRYGVLTQAQPEPAVFYVMRHILCAVIVRCINVVCDAAAVRDDDVGGTGTRKAERGRRCMHAKISPVNF